MIGAREAALLALKDIFCDGKYSNLAVKEMLAKCRGMKSVEKALFTNLVYGVVSRHYTIEYVISKYSSVKVKKIAIHVRLILELGIYQIMYMDKIPDSAAVNESVNLAKRYCKKGSERFVNGVLRNVSRTVENLEYPKDIDKYLSAKHSYSTEMTHMFVEIFGKSRAESIMESLNEAPQLLLRANITKITPKELLLKLQSEEIECELCEDNMIAAKGFDIAENDLYRQGMFSVQDRGAYNAAIALEPEKGEVIIDMCAAPGGKTTHIAELTDDNAKIFACDIYEHKLKLIEKSAERLGLSSITTVLSDSTEFNSDFRGIADRVLCDVPCSGWGIIKRKPDIKLSHTELSELYEIQSSILHNASKYLKKGGVVVYSTCTLNTKENEDTTGRFLEENKNYEKVYEKTYYPDKDNSDGFYICKMKRND